MSSFLVDIHGMALANGGTNAAIGVGPMTCAVSTASGALLADYEYLGGDEYPQDYEDYPSDATPSGGAGLAPDAAQEAIGSRLLVANDQGEFAIVGSDETVERFAVAGLKSAAFAAGGIVAYTEFGGGCGLWRLADNQATEQPVPAEACGGAIAVDPETGTVWLANGDLWSVDAAGVATLEVADAADLLTVDPVNGHPAFAVRGGSTVTSLAGWQVDTKRPILGLGHLGALGAVGVVTDGASASANSTLVAMEGDWGGIMLEQTMPPATEDFVVDDAGSVLAVGLGAQQAYYSIGVD